MISYSKYSGCGNVFVLIDNRTGIFHFNENSIQKICREKKVDGVILLVDSSLADYRMRILNADGSEAEMCGNGLRCFGIFLKELGLPGLSFKIEVMEKIYPIEVKEDSVTVAMVPPVDIRSNLSVPAEGREWAGDYLDTGVPHFVIHTDDIEEISIITIGPALRHHSAFSPKGTNVDFVMRSENGLIQIRTYERGVEAETLACGTGAAAAAVSCAVRYGLKNPITIKTRSGEDLLFRVETRGHEIESLIMEGPASKISSGFLS